MKEYAYDPAKTEELLEELGYIKDGKPLEIEMLITSTDERAGEMIKQQLEQAGFKIALRSLDSRPVTAWSRSGTSILL